MRPRGGVSPVARRRARGRGAAEERGVLRFPDDVGSRELGEGRARRREARDAARVAARRDGFPTVRREDGERVRARRVAPRGRSLVAFSTVVGRDGPERLLVRLFLFAAAAVEPRDDAEDEVIGRFADERVPRRAVASRGGGEDGGVRGDGGARGAGRRRGGAEGEKVRERHLALAALAHALAPRRRAALAPLLRPRVRDDHADVFELDGAAGALRRAAAVFDAAEQALELAPRRRGVDESDVTLGVRRSGGSRGGGRAEARLRRSRLLAPVALDALVLVAPLALRLAPLLLQPQLLRPRLLLRPAVPGRPLLPPAAPASPGAGVRGRGRAAVGIVARRRGGATGTPHRDPTRTGPPNARARPPLRDDTAGGGARNEKAVGEEGRSRGTSQWSKT